MDYVIGVDIGGTHGSSVGGRGFVWLLELWPTTDLEVPGLGYKIVEGGLRKTRPKETKSSIRSAVDLPRHRYGMGM